MGRLKIFKFYLLYKFILIIFVYNIKQIKIMYYFIIEKETNNIICKSLETNETLATAVTPYGKDCDDYWTSIEIGGELFDINIWYENEYSNAIVSRDENDKIILIENSELIQKGVADNVQLYRLEKNYKGEYSNNYDNFETYNLTFEG